MNETLKTIYGLRTIHGGFADRDISSEDMSQIIDAALRAANASARQSYSFVVVDEKQTMKRLFGYTGSKAIVFCVDYARLDKLAKQLGHPFDNADIIGFITGAVDTALAAQTSVIAARSLGIDSLVTNGIHRSRLDDIYDILNLPRKSCFPLIAVVYGYAKSEPEYKKGRIKNATVVHYGKYCEATSELTDKTIEEYDDHDRHLGLIDNWEELGFEHYLDWFFTKWSGKPSDDKLYEFYKVLAEAGFIKDNTGKVL